VKRKPLLGDERGGIALFLGLALPTLLVGGGAALEYASLASRRAELQKAADTTALAAAQELKIATADDMRIKAVAKSVALAGRRMTRPP
jgi:Flp pilus assembly protein TadG